MNVSNISPLEVGEFKKKICALVAITSKVTSLSVFNCQNVKYLRICRSLVFFTNDRSIGSAGFLNTYSNVVKLSKMQVVWRQTKAGRKGW